MGEWVECTLGEAPVEIIDGDRGKNYPKQTEFADMGHCLFLNAKNVTSTGFVFSELNFIDQNRDDLLRKGKLKRGDLVLTTRGTVGNVAYYDESVAYDHIRINSGMVIIRPVDIDERFNCQLFKSLSKSFEVFATGSAQPQLPIRDLREIPISLPPLEEQRAIAAVLSALDDKTDLLHRQNRTLESLAQALFRHWFIDGAGADWEEKPFQDVLDIAIGRTPPRKESHWFTTDTTDVKWISIKDMGSSGMFVFETAECLTIEAIRQFNIPIIPVDSVILSFKMTVGRVGITSEAMTSNEAIAHFKIGDDTPFVKEYLYFFLKLFRYEELGSTSSIVTSINSQMIKELKIPIPDADVMRRFEETVRSQFGKIRTNQIQIRTLAALRDTLLPKLMSGEVRVRV